jgi:hypothetical protein
MKIAKPSESNAGRPHTNKIKTVVEYHYQVRRNRPPSQQNGKTQRTFVLGG